MDLDSSFSFFSYFNSDLVDKKKSWKFCEFYFWGKKNKQSCDQIPELNKILISIPGFISAGISVLSANTDIKAHCGDTNTIYRAHLGLSVPESYPRCGFQVGTEEKGWEEGKILLFCDANKHRAWNHSNLNRTVLIVDVIREQFLSQRKNICSNVLSSIALQKLEEKHPFVKSFPGIIKGGIRLVFKFSILIKL